MLSGPGWTQRFSEGERLLRRVVRAPGPKAVWDASERFTDRVGLASARLQTLLRGARRRGGRAAQAMFGQSFFLSIPPGDAGRELRRWVFARADWLVDVGLARTGAGRVPRGPE